MPSSRKSAFKGHKVLITSGPASVPIDDMRVITNRSTGAMGRLLASAFVKSGARVTLLEGAVTTSLPLPSAAVVKKFYFYDDLARLLDKELPKSYDIVVHAAAVPDFALKKPFKDKLDSHDQISLVLVPTRKLIGTIKTLAPTTFLVGFKFEANISDPVTAAKAQRLIEDHSCDRVVLNENNARGYRAVILSADGSMTGIVHSKKTLVKLLLRT